MQHTEGKTGTMHNSTLSHRSHNKTATHPQTYISDHSLLNTAENAVFNTFEKAVIDVEVPVKVVTNFNLLLPSVITLSPNGERYDNKPIQETTNPPTSLPKSPKQLFEAIRNVR